jgi:hypothetical protein
MKLLYIAFFAIIIFGSCNSEEHKESESGNSKEIGYKLIKFENETTSSIDGLDITFEGWKVGNVVVKQGGNYYRLVDTLNPCDFNFRLSHLFEGTQYINLDWKNKDSCNFTLYEDPPAKEVLGEFLAPKLRAEIDKFNQLLESGDSLALEQYRKANALTDSILNSPADSIFEILKKSEQF